MEAATHHRRSRALSGACFPLPSLQAVRRLSPLRVKSIPNYVWSTMFAALGGWLWGFDTGSIGPITIMPQFEAQFGTISATVQGLIVSSILLTASIAAFGAGPLADRISRTWTIALGAAIFAVGSLLACSATTLAQLFVGRSLAGVGEGLFASIISVYTCEIAPTASRGRLVFVAQLFNVCGICIGYFVCYGTLGVPSGFSWRFPLAMQAVVATVLTIGALFLPHSPHWLRQVGREADVETTWAKLGVSRAEAEKEAENMRREEALAQSAPNSSPWYKRVPPVWAKDVRWRTLFGLFLLGMQQAFGIDAVLYYAPILFAQAGLSSKEASFLASGVSGLLNVVFTIPVQLYADKWGRRVTLIGGGAVIAATMLTIGTLYATSAHETRAGGWTIVILIYIFVIAFVTTWAGIARLVVSEIQPTKTRAAAAGLGQCANWAVNYIIAFSTPLFLARSNSGPYFFFGGCTVLTVLVCLAFQPETRGLSLEDIDSGLGISPWRAALDKMRKRRGSDAAGVLEDVEHSEVVGGVSDS